MLYAFDNSEEYKTNCSCAGFIVASKGRSVGRYPQPPVATFRVNDKDSISIGVYHLAHKNRDTPVEFVLI